MSLRCRDPSFFLVEQLLERTFSAGVSVEMSCSLCYANCSDVRGLPSCFFFNDPDGFETGGDTSTIGFEVL